MEDDTGGTGPRKLEGEDACWPDPPPRPHTIWLDDVTRMNSVKVSRMFHVRSVSDVQHVLACARRNRREVCVRGTKHSMGGHTLAPNAYMIDMSWMQRMSYDASSQSVTAECGAQWSALIQFLNSFGRSPRTMQSYSSFSVGGTISVNAHGITTDFTLSESVLRFTLVKGDGSVVVCSREGDGEAAELFRAAIGGYGLFGVITEVTMKTNANVHLDMDVFHVKVKEFPALYEAMLQQEEVEIKLARVDITSLDSVEVYVFRRGIGCHAVSQLPPTPRHISPVSRLLYKWLAPTMKELRFSLERSFGVALDWGDAGDRNVMMYESAEPLARLYSPLFHIDDTFILQEYFVPRRACVRWLTRARDVYDNLLNHPLITLLNTTIRFVHPDSDTLLRYAQAPDGMYAFVLYFRLRRSEEADRQLMGIQQEFIDITMGLSGTFYLPYRHHYTKQQLWQAYPMIDDFFQLKLKHDPDEIFSNSWYEHYAPGARDRLKKKRAARSDRTDVIPPVCGAVGDYQLRRTSDRRTDSYRVLLKSAEQRRLFSQVFLTEIFNIESNTELFSIISKASWNPDNRDDVEVFASIKDELSQRGGALKAAITTWKQVSQLRDQKEELRRETLSIVGRVGKLGEISNYVSIGDHGKLVLELREALGINGRVWVVHDEQSVDIRAVLERGSPESVGKFVSIDYDMPVKVDVESEAADLVTINQGLHHLPQEYLLEFLRDLFRILRPGGLLIIREHNATPDLIPMLDLAHSVFNAVTGVSRADERKEIRAFRPTMEWREIVESVGFVDTMVYEMQPHDPTWDEMMCFSKGQLHQDAPRVACEQMMRSSTDMPIGTSRDNTPVILPQLSSMLSGVPSFVLQMMKNLLETVEKEIPSIVAQARELATCFLTPGIEGSVFAIIDKFVSTLRDQLDRFRPFLENVQLTDGAHLELVPRELFLIIPALQEKVKQGRASVQEELVVGIMKDIMAAVAVGGKNVDESVPPCASSSPSPGENVEGEASTRAASSSRHANREEDVRAELEQLVAEIPVLSNVSVVVDEFGLPPLAERALRTFLLGREDSDDGTSEMIARLARRVSALLDDRAWSSLKSSLEGVRAAGDLPTVERVCSPVLVGESINAHPWGIAALAFLGSSKVQMSRSMRWQLSYVGLNDFVSMWRVAQQRRREEVAGDCLKREQELAPVQEAFDAVVSARIHTVYMNSGDLRNVERVQRIVCAKFGYQSITADYTDVTSLLENKYLRNNTLYLRGVDILEEIGGGGALDSIRMVALGKVRRLKVEYVQCENVDGQYQSRVDVLLDALANGGFIRKLHAEDGEYTWFKLVEWMQVEMVEVFGKYMHSTPWYRFPFLSFLATYFGTLFEEVKVVARKHGLQKALFSQAFVVDLVPGIVMTALLGQMHILALPLRAYAGEEYDEPETMVEQIVLGVARGSRVKWRDIDKRIVDARLIVPSLYVVTVPTFEPFTEILVKIALKIPVARIFQISNQKEVQVKVLLPRPRGSEQVETVEDEGSSPELILLKRLDGCEVMFTYKLPVDGSGLEPRTFVSICVQVSCLLAVIRACDGAGIKVEMIYDWWN